MLSTFQGVKKIEEKLRDVQCLDALDTLWSIGQAKHETFVYRDVNMHGQAHQTRAVSFVEHLERKMQEAAEKYRTVRIALMGL